MSLLAVLGWRLAQCPKIQRGIKNLGTHYHISPEVPSVWLLFATSLSLLGLLVRSRIDRTSSCLELEASPLAFEISCLKAFILTWLLSVKERVRKDDFNCQDPINTY